ncbi:uncharacterized protein [Miscanthus floridulus]|uniref:uncharacterized protein n=1 Tax=Miscanthus floridulus TaxID=154761 RepID=UPI00345949F3
MVPTKNHVLAALLLCRRHRCWHRPWCAGGPLLTIVSAAKAVFGVVPCSTGSSINVVTATPFANASLQLQCGIPHYGKHGKATAPEVTYNPADEPEVYTSASVHSKLSDYTSAAFQNRYAGRGPVVSAAGITVWANAEADTNGDFMIELGVIRNSGGGGGLLSSMLLANQGSVVVTTPLATCNMSLAGVTGTLSAPVQVVGGMLPCLIGGLLGLDAGPFSFI